MSYYRATEGATTHYAARLTQDMLTSVTPGVEVTTIPEPPELDLPQRAHHLWQEAEAAGLTWILRQHHDDGDLITALEIYGLRSPTDNGTHFVWCGEQLSPTTRRRMSLRTAHTRIAELSSARASA